MTMIKMMMMVMIIDSIGRYLLVLVTSCSITIVNIFASFKTIVGV